MKSGRVYEVAGRLKRKMDDVLHALQEMGSDVTGYSSLVDDEDIGKLAESYGKTIQLPFIPDIPKAECDGQKLAQVPAEVVEVMGRVLDSADDTLKIYASRPDKTVIKSAIKLISNESKSVYTVNMNVQLFLIPQLVKNEKPCRFRLDKHVMINGTLNTDACMVLLIVGSRIFYEPAAFVFVDGIWYFDAYGFMRSKGVEPEGKLNPRYAGKFSSYKKLVLPSERGYGTQVKNGAEYEVTLRVDSRKMAIGHGAVGEFSWTTAYEKYTLRGSSTLRVKLLELFEGPSEIETAEFEEFLNEILDIMKHTMTKMDAEDVSEDAELPEFNLNAVVYTAEDELVDLAKAAIDATEEAETCKEEELVVEEEAMFDSDDEEVVETEENVSEVIEEIETLEVTESVSEEENDVTVEKVSEESVEEVTEEVSENVVIETVEAAEEEVVEEFDEDWEPWMLEDSKEEEAYLRLCALVQAGLAPKASREFLRYGSIFYSQGEDGQLYSLEENDLLADTVADFEESHDAVAFYAMVADSDQGQLLNIFYVTEEREQWEMERQWLDNMNPIVFIENLDSPERSSFGSIRFRMVGEGTVRD